jgi:hypothetical protein
MRVARIRAFARPPRGSRACTFAVRVAAFGGNEGQRSAARRGVYIKPLPLSQDAARKD